MTVTLNRPKAKNAANKALAEGVAAAMDELDSNDDIRSPFSPAPAVRSAPVWT